MSPSSFQANEVSPFCDVPGRSDFVRVRANRLNAVSVDDGGVAGRDSELEMDGSIRMCVGMLFPYRPEH
jgi:hypothetical protein